MTQLAVDNQSRCQLDEAQVGVSALLPADQQPPEAVEPAMTRLDYPAARRVPSGVARRWQWLGLARLGRDVRRVAVGGGRLAAGVIVIAPVQTQVRPVVRRRVLGH